MRAPLVLILPILGLVLGCSGSSEDPIGPSLGGAVTSGGSSTGVGGSVNSSGGSSIGGNALGGAVNAGGSSASVGGAPNAGGASSTGGTSAGGSSAGGATNTGGAVTRGGGAATGGSSAGGSSAGGATSTGGTATGGATNAGGNATTGGSTTAGGNTATGGTVATGGATNAGGTNTNCSTTPTCITPSVAGNAAWNAPGVRNPIVPGYFADGTVKKFGDTYYLYATTDGVKNAAGDPSIWVSKDFVNWYNLKVTMPTGSQTGPGNGWAWWAPDVIQSGGTYYYYHANSNLALYGASSSSPTGPWTSMGQVMGNNYVSGVLTLDGQTFTDTDGSVYMYFCTWASSNSGCGWAKFNTNMKSFSESGLIANAQLGSGLNIGEAPFMLYANSKYYFMYSNGNCFDGSYQVRYSTGSSPKGPFTYAKAILSSSSDDTVNGPGHHSVVQEGSDYYIVYHRHDNPHSTGGEFRQECADKLTFDTSGNINVITPSHAGVGHIGTDQNPTCNMAYTRTVTASSSYTDTSRSNFNFKPEYAVDDNNGTLWKAGDSLMGHWLKIDLGSVQTVARIMTQFEYATYYYQYLIETSTDGTTFTTYADRQSNKIPGSPMVDTATACARYVRIRITGVEKPGLYAAIFNVKVFGTTTSYNPTDVNAASTAAPAPSRGNLLVKLDASTLTAGSLSSWTNAGSLGGSFAAEGGSPTVGTVSSRQAVTFSGTNRMRASFKAPASISWQSPYTAAGWFLNPSIGERECLFSWTDRGGPQAAYSSMMYGTSTAFGASAHWDAMDMPYRTVPSANTWHHIALVYDGQVEKVYVDGTLNNQEQKYLQAWPNGSVILGDSAATDVEEHFSGSVASFRMYDVALDAASVTALMNGTEPTLPTPPAAP